MNIKQCIECGEMTTNSNSVCAKCLGIMQKQAEITRKASHKARQRIFNDSEGNGIK